MGKQLSRFRKLQILPALHFISVRGCSLQHDNYSGDLEPPHLQIKPVHDEFPSHFRLCLGCRTDGL